MKIIYFISLLLSIITYVLGVQKVKCMFRKEFPDTVLEKYKAFPRIKNMAPKRYASIAMSQGMPTAISPNLHRPGFGIGYCNPEYYVDEGYQVVEFANLIGKDIVESDISIEDFLGLTGG